MGYPSYPNPKFPVDYIVGDYYEWDATPVALNPGDYITIDVTLPDGLTYDVGTNKIKGVATTVADTDIVVSLFDSGDVLLNTYPYTIVVLELDITTSLGSPPYSFAAYTTRTDTFAYSVTGSYTSDGEEYSDPEEESGLPQGLTLDLSIPGFTGFAKDVGRFKAVVTVTDTAGHTFKKYFPFTTTTGTPSGSQIPSMDYVYEVGRRTDGGSNGAFSQNYSAYNGNNPYTWLHYSTDYGITKTPINVNARTGVMAGNWALGDDPPKRGSFKMYLRDSIMNTKVFDIPGEVVQLVCPHLNGLMHPVDSATPSVPTMATGTRVVSVATGLAITAGDPVRLEHDQTKYMDGTVTSYSGSTLTTNITSVVGAGTLGTGHIYLLKAYVWFTTYDGGTYRLYRREIFSDTNTEAFTSSYPIVGLAAGNTQMCVVDGPQTVGMDTNVFICHKINASTPSEGTPTNYVAPVDVTINCVEQYGANLDEFVLCVNHNGNTGDAPQYYNATANTIADFTNVPAGKNYTAYSYGTGYKLFINQTDASLIRVTTSYTGAITTHAVSGGLFNGSCALDRIIVYNGTDAYITDSGANLVYKYIFSTNILSTQLTLASGAKPADLMYLGNSLFGVYQQGLNSIRIYEYNEIATWTYIYTIYLNRQYNKIALDVAPQTTITYNMVGPIKPGTVKVHFETTDLGKLVSTDSAGVMSAVGDGGPGTVDYCTGELTIEYPSTATGTPYLYYENTPTRVVTSGSAYSPNFMYHNLELCQFDYQEKNIFHGMNGSQKPYNSTSTTHLTADLVTPILHTTTLTWPTGHTPTAGSVLSGTIPPGLVLNWPAADNTHFSLSGTCSTPGIYVFTVVIPGTEP